MIKQQLDLKVNKRREKERRSGGRINRMIQDTKDNQ